MKLDHSLTYREKKIRNIPHILRLKKILKLINKYYHVDSGTHYIDYGCSNGYIADIIRSQYNLQHVVGRDHNLDNLEEGRKRHPNIEFIPVDLNKEKVPIDDKYDLVTCFETIEHVGNADHAIDVIYSTMKESNSMLLISVPIEIGFWGILKCLAKYCLGYKIEELTNEATKGKYLKDLCFRGKIGQYRDEREGWGTHFGYDYRETDALLHKKYIPFKARNYFTTRFYIIKK